MAPNSRLQPHPEHSLEWSAATVGARSNQPRALRLQSSFIGHRPKDSCQAAVGK